MVIHSFGKSARGLFLSMVKGTFLAANKAAEGKSVGTEELELKRKDGSRLQIEITGNIIKLKNQILVLGILRDISERKRMEEEIKRKK